MTYNINCVARFRQRHTWNTKPKTVRSSVQNTYDFGLVRFKCLLLCVSVPHGCLKKIR